MHLAATIGCVACRMNGFPDSPAQLHHPRAKAGMGERGPHDEVISLCLEHHLGKNGIHNDPVTFHKRYGSDAELSKYTRELVDAIVILGRGVRRNR